MDVVDQQGRRRWSPQQRTATSPDGAGQGGREREHADQWGDTPLMAAVMPYNAAAMNYLMDLDADVELKNKTMRRS